ncbi:hypothetical protein J6590_008134 [Homalodisca vitripennis]|nr:hypothetical protein J6590_008134 [Homalodisca vitripennis]
MLSANIPGRGSIPRLRVPTSAHCCSHCRSMLRSARCTIVYDLVHIIRMGSQIEDNRSDTARGGRIHSETKKWCKPLTFTKSPNINFPSRGVKQNDPLNVVTVWIPPQTSTVLFVNRAHRPVARLYTVTTPVVFTILLIGVAILSLPFTRHAELMPLFVVMKRSPVECVLTPLGCVLSN